MRRCGKAAGLVGVAAWWVACVVVELMICLMFAVPFGLLFVLDLLVGDRNARSVLTVVPPAPPHEPFAVPRPAARLAA